MEIKDDRIVFDVWISHGMWDDVKKDLHEILVDSIKQRERLHGLQLDIESYSHVVHEHKFERKYCVKVYCKILKK